jgi:hypothetical protein
MKELMEEPFTGCEIQIKFVGSPRYALVVAVATELRDRILARLEKQEERQRMLMPVILTLAGEKQFQPKQ